MSTSHSDVISAFWSYPRMRSGPGLDALFRSMEKRLADVVLPATIEIFRDTRLKRGIGSGSNWSAELVRAAGSSMLFFWNQSPLWVYSEMCKFEMEMFRNRIDRVADRFMPGASGDQLDELRKAMIVPIRWHGMSPDQWQSFTGPNASLIHREWDLSNIITPLDFSVQRDGDALPDAGFYEGAANVAAQFIKAQIEHIYQLINVKRADLLEFLATDLPDFRNYWNAQFTRRHPSDDAENDLPSASIHGLSLECNEQRRHAWKMTEGSTTRQSEHLPVLMTLVWPGESDAKGFWASSGPLASSQADFWQSYYVPAGAASHDNAGSLLFDARSARELQGAVSKFGLSLPDAAQARRLREIYDLLRSTRYQLRFTVRARDFWYLSEAGELAKELERSTAAQIVLVEPLRQRDHE
ncbi:hypothetical protein AWB69_08972 [Caballeronia udeis]|uniref:Uncharacterized protein n=1 Tax=Caballeronia udeis TaxID=1232866 RepID=A0A158JWT4_9BURK|nr:hypothetical protein [Caballeronia udeis]SAL73277.1 hypothetical protein AWB69_08972 [Caballeronia udeis]